MHDCEARSADQPRTEKRQLVQDIDHRIVAATAKLAARDERNQTIVKIAVGQATNSHAPDDLFARATEDAGPFSDHLRIPCWE